MPFDPKDRRPTSSLPSPSNPNPNAFNNPTSTAPPAPSTYVAPPAVGRASFAGSTTDLDRLREERLASALKAIGLDFDAQELGFRNEIRDLKTLFDSSILQNTRGTENTTEDTEEAFLARGLFGSGIHATQLAENLEPLATERASLISTLNPVSGAEGTQVRDLLSAIGLLAPAEATAEASARLEAEQSELEMQQLIAMIVGGLG